MGGGGGAGDGAEESGEGGRSGTRQKIVTQPREEGCDLAELGAERERQRSGKEDEDAGVWRCSGSADYPIGT